MQGSIFINRKILDSWIFASEKKLKIWLWCLLRANYKDQYVSVIIGKGEKTIEIKRSQFLFGRFKAEKELNIDGSTIYKILKSFEIKEMIELNSNNHYTIITICNYDTYQALESNEVTAIEQPLNSHVTTNGKPRNTYKKDNKDNNIYLSKIYFEKSTEIDSAFKDYLKVRIENKFTMTERAINALIEKLRVIAGNDRKEALKIIDNAILGKWKSFYKSEN